MSELALDTTDGRVIDLRREPTAAARLPRGKAAGRYRCCACGKDLIFSGPATAQSHFTPRFRHDGADPSSDRCGAPAAHQADVQADLTVLLDLRDRLTHALPGATVHLAIDPQLAGQRWGLPPALVIDHGDHVTVIDRPRRPLTKPAADSRLKAVRTTYGNKAAHWWFFDRDDPQQYIESGTVKVRVNGTPDTHQKVRPTPVQRQVTRAGGTVYWIAQDTVLIPYGGHPHTYGALEGEDWSGEMASWSRDWQISHPSPADGAAWWGLIPVPLLGLGQHTLFRPVGAFAVMTALEKAQRGREAHRRGLAREHAQRSPVKSPPAQPAPAAQPSAAPAMPPAPTLASASSVTAPVAVPAPLPPQPVLPPPPVERPSLSRVTVRRRLSWSQLLPRRWRR